MPPITLTDLPDSANSYELEGTHYDGVPASLMVYNGPPGSGPRLHSHPYAELFVVQEGAAEFVVGGGRITATAGHILIAPASNPHKFTNSGSGVFQSIDIRLSDHFITEWIEEEPFGRLDLLEKGAIAYGR